MTSAKPMDTAWGALIDAPKAERESQMKQRYTELAKLPEDQRISKLVEMARAEYTLVAEKLRESAISRYESWLLLDPEAARQIARDYDTAMLQMNSSAAMHRVALAQTLAREFDAEARERLDSIIPEHFGTFAAEAQARSKVLGRPSKNRVIEVEE